MGAYNSSSAVGAERLLLEGVGAEVFLLGVGSGTVLSGCGKYGSSSGCLLPLGAILTGGGIVGTLSGTGLSGATSESSVEGSCAGISSMVMLLGLSTVGETAGSVDFAFGLGAFSNAIFFSKPKLALVI